MQPINLQTIPSIQQQMRAMQIKNSLGTRQAAGYLRNRDYSLAQTLQMLRIAPTRNPAA